ncbi:glycosyltransferase [Saccharicrinis sp. FJH62]|uniref:glycosyltransferase n=1 Tax=Saccharicrinis sp. FJH62 TaxID=3344657 RepID=UPI0035D413CF
MNNHNILVSICITTYNHGDFIQQALEGCIMQKTNFDIEILINDDASTDKTVEILRKYEEEYPDIIKPVFQTSNQYSKGVHPMAELVYPRAGGKYIALCEGDDYWTDPYKLQKQVDFLEKNSDFGMVCTDYKRFYQEKKRFKDHCFRKSKYNSEVKYEDYLLDRSTIGTATVLFKQELLNKYYKEIPEKVRYSWNVGDTPMWLYFSIKSKIGVLNIETAVYRVLKISACHFKNPLDHYNFVLKGFEIPDYFIAHYTTSESIKKEIAARKKRAKLHYAYKIRDRKLFEKELRSYRIEGYKLNKSFILRRIGLLNNFFYQVSEKILKRT